MNSNHIPHEFHESHLAGDQVPLAARIQRCPAGHLFDYGSRVGSLNAEGCHGRELMAGATGDDHATETRISDLNFPRPKLVSVEFTMQCHAEDLIPHDPGAMLGSDKVSTGIHWQGVVQIVVGLC